MSRAKRKYKVGDIVIVKNDSMEYTTRFVGAEGVRWPAINVAIVNLRNGIVARVAGVHETTAWDETKRYDLEALVYNHRTKGTRPRKIRITNWPEAYMQSLPPHRRKTMKDLVAVPARYASY